MTPRVNYVLNEKGVPVFVQLSVQEWEVFLNDYKRLSQLLRFKSSLKAGFEEIRQIQKGDVKGTTLKDFLNEF